MGLWDAAYYIFYNEIFFFLLAGEVARVEGGHEGRWGMSGLVCMM